ncbi:hypothetical protein [Vibrio fluvialis]|uniref:hypothetical protein n=1 Tax=Vibrio fluvialis TaxID=676 RepID=UPI001EEC97E6|nr:hypothetical protein [Vibrio fluvialis]MCG6401182.1 hypothetical protein [Vibrio fluvialis]
MKLVAYLRPPEVSPLSAYVSISGDRVTLEYHTAEFMGTDGWRELDIESEHARSILAAIQPELIEHLA